MNKNRFSLTSLLAAVLMVSVALTLGLCFRYARTLTAAREMQKQALELQVKIAQVNRNRAIVQALAVDALKHARDNAEMAALVQGYVPMFEQLNMRVNQVDSTASQSANP